ncbi:major facilitator superfamily domain-containing protein [Suillus clintonianus]|uniref:major facilitator superfamily domain-containing protein n=1 Tax=Suillus clintonianus TaxID=1904413 RepID=UPI001B875B3C|nr:major facilitator superfamily domain-containing protein [Suillus clintonianus]KAG2146251.1 major facilitator superfamily domain-containing protein [Suillus clintonianus]
MITSQDDEETPLLQQPEQSIANLKTPLPWDQFWILLFLQIPDPLVLGTLSPLAPQLIRDIGVTNGDESQVGHYVGVLHSSYYVAQIVTILYLSQLSDRIGRKPLIMTALFVIALTMLSFGLSRTFLGLLVRFVCHIHSRHHLSIADILISRIICGTFSGGDGLVKNALMDITDATNLPKAYGYMPLPWMLAAIIGPLVGGSLFRPADRFPEIFGRSELLKTYPYLLPCAVPAVFATVCCLVTSFHLNESIPTRTPLWELIKEWLPRQSYAKPSMPSSDVLASSGEAHFEEVPSKPLPLRAVLTPRVRAAAASYCTLTLFYIAVFSILPLFYATPIELGGLSLDPPRIGAILAASSFSHGAVQLLFFSRLHDRFGPGALNIAGVSSGIPIVMLFPVINALARAHGLGLMVWLLVGVQLGLMAILAMCYCM